MGNAPMVRSFRVAVTTTSSSCLDTNESWALPVNGRLKITTKTTQVFRMGAKISGK
jgi:hypothetical protein